MSASSHLIPIRITSCCLSVDLFHVDFWIKTFRNVNFIVQFYYLSFKERNLSCRIFSCYEYWANVEYHFMMLLKRNGLQIIILDQMKWVASKFTVTLFLHFWNKMIWYKSRTTKDRVMDIIFIMPCTFWNQRTSNESVRVLAYLKITVIGVNMIIRGKIPVA